jgi:hypothetical protein
VALGTQLTAIIAIQLTVIIAMHNYSKSASQFHTQSFKVNLHFPEFHISVLYYLPHMLCGVTTSKVDGKRRWSRYLSSKYRRAACNSGPTPKQYIDNNVSKRYRKSTRLMELAGLSAALTVECYVPPIARSCQKEIKRDMLERRV